MKDLTRGPVAGHVLQLAGFIALTTTFQTLYFLADLYFVGTLGREAIAGVSLAGNLDVPRARAHAGARRRCHVADRPGARAQGARAGRAGVQPGPGARQPHRPGLRPGGLRGARGLLPLARCRCRDGRAGHRVSGLVRAGAGAAVSARGAGSGAARHGRHEDPDHDPGRDRAAEHRARADADLRLGERAAAGRRRRGARLAGRDRGGRRRVRRLLPARRRARSASGRATGFRGRACGATCCGSGCRRAASSRSSPSTWCWSTTSPVTSGRPPRRDSASASA